MVYALQVSIVHWVSVTKQHGSQDNRIDERAKENTGSVRKAFFLGGNSSCRAHIRQHYGLYKQRCKERNIPENHHTIPRPIWREMQLKKQNPKAKTQHTLDGAVKTLQGPREFTREGVLRAVTQFVACDDQVSFKNMLMN